MKKWWEKLKDVVVHKILGLDDAPSRIAWGVFLGCVVAMTPTLGLQILLYVSLATMLRVNKISGIPILFISNPFTAVPLYGFCWWVGNLLLHGGEGSDGWGAVSERLFSDDQAAEGLWSHLLSLEFWQGVGQAMVELGGEMWLGSFVLGFLLAVPSYFLTMWGVGEYRRRHATAADEDSFVGDNRRFAQMHHTDDEYAHDGSYDEDGAPNRAPSDAPAAAVD